MQTQIQGRGTKDVFSLRSPSIQSLKTDIGQRGGPKREKERESKEGAYQNM